MGLEETFRRLCDRYRDDSASEQDDQAVIARYGFLFSPERLDRLTREEFKSFLAFKNNRHWWGIQRQGNAITRDMNRLREALSVLLDEERDVRERFRVLFPKNQKSFVKGLGRAVATTILAVVYPDKYGVFNSKSEMALKALELWPEFEGADFADTYVRVNEVLKQLTQERKLSLLRLDRVLGEIAGEPAVDEEDEEIDIGGERVDAIRFGLEKHLEDFLVENWERTPLGERFELLEEDGDIVGQQYAMNPIGRADLVCRERGTGHWVVIELKRGRESDRVVGELARYMGWLIKHKARPDEPVLGVIIAGDVDARMVHALAAVPNTEMFKYVVDFQLEEVPAS